MLKHNSYHDGKARPRRRPDFYKQLVRLVDAGQMATHGLRHRDRTPRRRPVDWKAFLASPEAATLQPQVKQMAGQFGQLLEKLAQKTFGAQLTDLSRDEFAALLIHVVPLVLPPQHLSPHALNAYQALAKFLHRTGAATEGDDLLQGVKLVRQLMTEQMRRSGILGGPDYSDPDEKPVIKK